MSAASQWLSRRTLDRIRAELVEDGVDAVDARIICRDDADGSDGAYVSNVLDRAQLRGERRRAESAIATRFGVSEIET